jgi:hypothetical protein
MATDQRLVGTEVEPQAGGDCVYGIPGHIAIGEESDVVTGEQVGLKLERGGAGDPAELACRTDAITPALDYDLDAATVGARVVNRLLKYTPT